MDGGEEHDRSAQGEGTPEDGELNEEALDQVSAGTAGRAHELAHTVQQSTSVGAAQTLTVGTNETTTVGGDSKK